MEVQSDFKELLELFNSHKVDYLIAGGFALAYHGAPRYTGDIDLYVKPEAENAHRIINSLQDFGFGSLDLVKEDFMETGQIIQLGMPPGRIDIITSISGVGWEEAKAGKVTGTCGEVPVSFLGREQFVKNKKATGRSKDLADLEALGEKTE
jgi:aminoglycoside-2''-adenylyltransferase